MARPGRAAMPGDDEEGPGDGGDEGGPGDGERIQKVLARAGIGSRRACDELVAAGRVTVDGTVAATGQRVDTARQRVAVDGVPVPVAPGHVYYLLNKPAGVVTTASDPEGRPTVVSLVPAEPRVFPVGRLDYDTEGLLVLTNDGELANLLSHPSHGVAKEYLAEVAGTPSAGAVRALRRGVVLEDGPTAPAVVGTVAPGVLRIVVHEGRNRQVRRMCEAVGHPVLRLVRTRIGPVRDPGLRPGSWRPLRQDEVQALFTDATAATAAGAAGKSGARSSGRRQPGRRGGPGGSPRRRQ